MVFVRGQLNDFIVACTTSGKHGLHAVNKRMCLLANPSPLAKLPVYLFNYSLFGCVFDSGSERCG